MRLDRLISLVTCASMALSVAVAPTALAQDAKPKPPQASPAGVPIKGGPSASPDQAKPGVRELLSPQQPQPTETRPENIAPPNEKPVVEFDPPIADMGEMIADVAKTVKIKIKNVHTEPIRITKAIPGCGCTTPTFPKDPIAPGGFGEAEITLKPGTKQGIKLSKKVTFQIENHAPVTLTVEGDVVAYVTMVPDLIEAPAEDAAKSAGGQVVLESTEGKAFKVTDVQPPVLKNPPTEAATKHVLTIDWAAWEAAGRQPKILFVTDNEKAPNLTLLVKRALAAGEARPPEAPKTPQGPATTALITAVRSGDLAKVSAELATGVDVNERDKAGQRTALHWAAKLGTTPVMEALVAAKADPNIADRQGRTPLWSAVETNLETARFLVEKGADVNARDQIKSSPLLWAAGFGKPETVAYLISKGAEVKAIDDNGWTPLIWAAGLGQAQTVDILVKSGADLNAADKQTGDTPLLRGARTGKADSLKILIVAGADLKAKNKLGQNALHLAAMSGSPDKVQILLDAKVDPSATDDKGWTALDHAMNRTTGDKTRLIEILKPVSPAPKSNG
ncbi:MAG: ankyrin repeat domain-containing protein [Phycisphaerales bacterium]